MNVERIIGLGAATLTTVAFVPQVWRSLKTHDTRGISLSMYAVFTSGVALWLAYGVLLGDLPIILANVVTLALASIVLVLKIRYG
jgi:MtN3 and saliva related transmembrane protein